jgi:heat shock protein HtpX
VKIGTQLKTVFLLTLLTGILWAVGFAVGGVALSLVFLVIGLAMNLAVYWFSDKLVLMSTGARPVSKQEAPELYSVVEELTAQSKMPMPKVYIMENESPNAFATGRNPKNAAVAATRGLLRIMDKGELAGVMAHELSHVRNRDTLVMTVVASVAGAISWLAWMAMWSMMWGGFGGRGRSQSPYAMLIMLAVVILAPIAATLVQLAISRAREYGADEGAARTFRKPLELASALEKLEAAVRRRPMERMNPAFSHLFIVNPLKGGDLMNNLFATHPPIAERARRLRQMAYNR